MPKDGIAAEQSAAPQTVRPSPVLTRRSLLTGAAATAAAGTVGALGAGLRARASTSRGEACSLPVAFPGGSRAPSTSSGEHAATSASDTEAARQIEIERRFHCEADRIQELHRQQTEETVTALKARYEHPVMGRMRVWDLIQKLALCVDRTDTRLFCASQWLHVCQTIAAMEEAGVTDPDLYVIAMLHDLGKVFLLTGEVPENVVCGSNRVGDCTPGVGLDKLVYQFGHGELIYSRVKGYVPDHMAWTLRYHSLDILDAQDFMDDRDRQHLASHLLTFREFDHNSKSPKWIPHLDMEKYRVLIERYFPEPILF